MFNDHLNFSNNLNDNLQIRKRLLKEAESRTQSLGDSETRNFIFPPTEMAGSNAIPYGNLVLGPDDNPFAGTPYAAQGQVGMSTRGALGPGRSAPYNPNDPYWSTPSGLNFLSSMEFIIQNWNNPKALIQRFGTQAGTPEGRQRLVAAYTRAFATMPNIAWPPQLHNLVTLVYQTYNK